MEFKFQAPGPDEPGYLRRQRKALEFVDEINKGNASPKLLDDMVHFLSQFVTEPKGRAKAKEALYDASETQFFDLLNAVLGTSGQVSPNT